MRMKAVLLSCLLAAMAVVNVFGADGFVGPSVSTRIVTVVEARQLKDDAKVVMRGWIVERVGRESYYFEDATGRMLLDIDDDVWIGLTVTPDDEVEIYGEVDRDYRRIEVEVKRITKL